MFCWSYSSYIDNIYKEITITLKRIWILLTASKTFFYFSLFIHYLWIETLHFKCFLSVNCTPTHQVQRVEYVWSWSQFTFKWHIGGSLTCNNFWDNVSVIFTNFEKKDNLIIWSFYKGTASVTLQSHPYCKLLKYKKQFF